MVHGRCYVDAVRWATLVVLTLLGCSDLREFRGAWQGHRVGDATVLHQNVDGLTAQLTIDQIDGHGLAARLAVDQLLPETPIASLAGAEADALAGLTFGGDPLRIYLAFAPVPDAGGDALVVVALYDDRRIEIRVMRGGAHPLYGIYALREAGAAS
jgi:hypothetical protein